MGKGQFISQNKVFVILRGLDTPGRFFAILTRETTL